MKYRNLGETDLSVSEVGFGVWTVSSHGWGITHPSDGVRLLQNAFDLGITLFDTSESYGQGYGEEIIPEALDSHRHEIIISTKFLGEVPKGFPFLSAPSDLEVTTPDQIRASCEKSLRRLKTDYIDLYQMHVSNPDLIFHEEIFEVLQLLVKEGKTRYFGINADPELEFDKDFFAPLASSSVSTIQSGFGILEPTSGTLLLKEGYRFNFGIITRNPHSVEMVSDLFWQTKESKRLLVDNPTFKSLAKPWIRGPSLEQLRFLTEHHPIPLTQLAIAFCLNNPAINSVLPDIANEGQLSSYSSAVYSEPPCSECVEEIEEAFGTIEEDCQESK